MEIEIPLKFGANMQDIEDLRLLFAEFSSFQNKANLTTEELTENLENIRNKLRNTKNDLIGSKIKKIQHSESGLPEILVDFLKKLSILNTHTSNRLNFFSKTPNF